MQLLLQHGGQPQDGNGKEKILIGGQLVNGDRQAAAGAVQHDRDIKREHSILHILLVQIALNAELGQHAEKLQNVRVAEQAIPDGALMGIAAFLRDK